MNRNLVVTIIVVVLIALAGGYYFMNRTGQAPVVTSEIEAQPSVAASVATEKTSLKNFMAMTGNRKCDFTDTETGNSGAVYLNSGKMRGDFSSTVSGKTSMTHMINDGKDAYIWMDDQTTGFKTNLEAIEQMSGQTGVAQTVDLNKQVDYKCEDWTPDPVKFAVPTEIKFQDMSKMLEDAMKRMPSISPNASTVTGGNAAACAACDNLEGAQKTSCKSALKCN